MESYSSAAIAAGTEQANNAGSMNSIISNMVQSACDLPVLH